MTLAEIDAGIAALTAALGAGTQSVRLADGSQVTYASAADVEARLRLLRNERDRVANGAALPGFRLRSYPVVMRRD